MKRALFSFFMFFLGLLPSRAQLVHVLSDGWTFSEAGKEQWKPAYVPGNVHRDLQMNNMIPDPTVGENYKLSQWVETKDWEYRTTFSYTDLFKFQNIELVFEGLDTYADVYLNDSLILKAKNMFVGYTVPVTRALKQENKLRIVFHNPVNYTKDLVKNAGIRYPADNDASYPFTRKAAVQYGWDFTQRLLTCGIWRKIFLRGWNGFIIRNISISKVSMSGSVAQMQSVVDIECASDDSLEIDLVANGVRYVKTAKKGLNTFVMPFVVFKAELWWPNGLGSQKLYTFNVQVQDKKFSSWKEIKYGIRTIEVVNQNDGFGKSFFVKVNGVPVYIKGCNYVPPLNMYRADAPSDPYPALFSAMKNCNMNMVRVWGGGVYEDDEFYDLADKTGILVWQDMMFANTMYPADDAFLGNVEEELTYNIKRLRQHTALALWCGNNEIEVAWKNWGWEKKYKYTRPDSVKLWEDYKLLFKTVELAVQANDPGRFYFNSSPQSNWGKPEDFKSGDNHYWGVWHGEEPFSSYVTHVPRFASEFGFQSFPLMSSVRRFSKAADWAITTPVMKAHQFSYKGSGLITKYMNRMYKAPKDFSSYLYLSQLLQAEGLKTAIEAQRINSPFCMGSLYWQLNDHWPAASWSTVDYYGKWKAGQYFVRKAFAPVLITITRSGSKLEAAVLNNGADPVQGDLRVKLMTMDGKVISLEDEGVKLGAVHTYPITDSVSSFIGTNDKKSVLLCVDFINTDRQLIASTIYYFSDPKDLSLPVPVIQKDISKHNDTVAVKLKTNVLAKNVFVSAGDAEMVNAVSDNYFDLLPGEERTVYFYSDKTVEEFKKVLSVKTLRDTY